MFAIRYVRFICVCSDKRLHSNFISVMSTCQVFTPVEKAGMELEDSQLSHTHTHTHNLWLLSCGDAISICLLSQLAVPENFRDILCKLQQRGRQSTNIKPLQTKLIISHGTWRMGGHYRSEHSTWWSADSRAIRVPLDQTPQHASVILLQTNPCHYPLALSVLFIAA